MTHRRLPSNAPADRIVSALQTQQHLRPHQTVTQALEAAGEEIAFCPEAAESAMSLLELSPASKVGRLRSTQLTQLARTIARLWQRSQPLPEQSPA